MSQNSRFATTRVDTGRLDAIWRGVAAVNRPGADFLRAGSKIALQTERVVGGIDHLR